MNKIDQFIQLESLVWDALVSGDKAADARLLADNFYGVYSTGFAGKEDHYGQLEFGPTAAEYRLSEARVKMLSPDVALLSYRADWKRVKEGQGSAKETMYVTSIWQRFGESWLNIFSQDTPGTDGG